MMVYGEGGDERVKIISTEQKFRTRFCLSEDNILKLSSWVMIIEDYYSNLRGKWTMDVEWAIDGLTNDLLLCKHVQKQSTHRNPTTITEYKIEDENRHDKLLLKVLQLG
jgi:pyruvate,water dikinase